MNAWPDIAVGQQVPPLVRTIALADMVAYAGATWDWHRLHYDEEFLRQKGLSRPVVDGQVFGALLVAMVQDWLGPTTFVAHLDYRLADLVYAGETVRCQGRVSEIGDDGGLVLALEVVVESEPERRTVGPANARVIRRP